MRDKAALEPIKPADLTIVGANQASWADLQAIFGTADYPGKCYCQHYRMRGITYALAAATIDFARDRGATALEAYPMITQPGQEITWGELDVGSRQVFAEAGFTEVSHPSPRRIVMRIDFKD
jgi:hypothetical protein